MITKFQALVARESMADCWSKDGQSVIVTALKFMRGGKWLVEVTFSDDSARWSQPSDVTPSFDVLTLIGRGIYREASMTWHDAQHGVQKLSY